MMEISNRHYSLLTDKLPRVLELARRSGGLTLRQQEDIRQLWLLHSALERKAGRNTGRGEAACIIRKPQHQTNKKNKWKGLNNGKSGHHQD